MEAVVYHAVIHLLMGALGFIPLPNKGRRDNFYLGHDWKYSKLQCRFILQPKAFVFCTDAITTLGNVGFRTNLFRQGALLSPRRSWHGSQPLTRERNS